MSSQVGCVQVGHRVPQQGAGRALVDPRRAPGARAAARFVVGEERRSGLLLVEAVGLDVGEHRAGEPAQRGTDERVLLAPPPLQPQSGGQLRDGVRDAVIGREATSRPGGEQLREGPLVADGERGARHVDEGPGGIHQVAGLQRPGHQVPDRGPGQGQVLAQGAGPKADEPSAPLQEIRADRLQRLRHRSSAERRLAISSRVKSLLSLEAPDLSGSVQCVDIEEVVPAGGGSHGGEQAQIPVVLDGRGECPDLLRDLRCAEQAHARRCTRPHGVPPVL